MTTVSGAATLPIAFPVVQPATVPQATTVPTVPSLPPKTVDNAAAPAAEPAYPAPVATTTSNTTGTSTPINPNPATGSDQNAANSVSSGIYTAVAGVNTSTIRGVNLNIQA